VVVGAVPLAAVPEEAVSDQLSLLDVPAGAKRERTDAAELWRERVRAALYRTHRGQRVTIDDAVALIEADPSLRRPSHVHANAAGTLFSHWPKARPVMVG